MTDHVNPVEFPHGPVESLTGEHDVDEFQCRSEAQTDWLRRSALQAHLSDTARVHVIRRMSDNRVVGYYALSNGAVGRLEMPDRVLKGVGRYNLIPVQLLARLGVDLSEEGKGLGRDLVKSALKKTADNAENSGIRCLLVHCENEGARRFYMHLSDLFMDSPVDPLQLFVLMKDIRRALGGAGF